MDDHDPPPPVVDEVYRFLEGINRWLGGHRATLERFRQLSHDWRPGERIEVLEVAAGGGDFARALVRWGRAHGFDIHVTALDISPSALRTARLRQVSARPEAGVRLVCGDVYRPPLRDGGVDYVTCALFFHHLTDADVVTTLRTFDRLATRGIVINDLIRRWRLFAWTWLFTSRLLKNTRIGLFSWPSCVSRPPDNGAHGDTLSRRGGQRHPRPAIRDTSPPDSATGPSYRRWRRR